jgi:mannose-6-phosphate isomerase-like protein (cupin superfamily)
MGATVIQPGEGELLGAGAYQLRFLAESPAEPIAITENAIPAHFPGPVLHRHRYLTDIFYVLEGTITIHLDGVEQDVGPGGFVLVPPGVVHSFANRGDEPARFLNIYQPAGNEQYLKELGKLLEAGTPLTPVLMAEVASRYDFEAAVE